MIKTEAIDHIIEGQNKHAPPLEHSDTVFWKSDFSSDPDTMGARERSKTQTRRQDTKTLRDSAGGETAGEPFLDATRLIATIPSLCIPVVARTPLLLHLLTHPPLHVRDGSKEEEGDYES